MEQPDHDQSMTDEEAIDSFTPPPSARAAVGRWSVDRYVRLIRPPVVIIGVFVVILVLFRVHQVAVTVIQASACVWVGLMVHRRGGQRIEAITAGAMIGLALGSMTGFSRFILEPSGYWFVNILFETIIFGLVGAILALGTVAARHITKIH